MYSQLAFQIVFFTLAIAGLIFVMRLRLLLGRIFPTYTAQLDIGTAPFGSEDLYEEAKEAFGNLEFEGPIWLRVTANPKQAEYFNRVAVFRHRQTGALCWLFPIFHAHAPNRLLSCWTTTLADGRKITSQAFDFYYEAISTKEYPAQTINGADYYKQFEQHQAFVESFSTDFDPGSLNDNAIVKQMENTDQQELLIEKGILYKNSQGIVRGRMKFAIKAFWLSLRRAIKSKHEKMSGTPVSRLANIADLSEKAIQIAPDSRTQFMIFSASLILSCVLGSIIFNWLFSVILVAVILFHELGHYLAMRLFGYTSVHMLALPLVGGVTIGYEVNPSAAKKAWMSLMGPLPGIILGWLLLWFSLEYEINSQALQMSIFLLLFINYLNILPILPLDGGHVIQSLIPGKWLRVQPAIIFITCMAGIIFGMISKFYILSFLCAIQLPRLIEQFKLGSLVTSVVKEGVPPESHPKSVRRQRVLEFIEKIRGPSRDAKQRLGEANQVLDTLYRKKLSLPQTFSLSAVYGLLLAVPILSAVYAISATIANSETEAKWEEENQEQSRVMELARGKTMGELVVELSGELQAPAGESQISAAESRLNASLPADLLALYRISNGIPGLGILPVEKLDYVAWEDDTMKPYVYEGKIYVEYLDDSEGYQSINVTVDQARSWVSLRDVAAEYEPFYLDLSPELRVEGRAYMESYDAFASIRDWVNQQWVYRKMDEWRMQNRQVELNKNLERLAGASVDDMLDEFESPNMVERLLLGIRGPSKGVSNNKITQLETELAITLPKSIKDVYRHHDAFEPLGLFAIDDIHISSSDELAKKIEEYPQPFRQVDDRGTLVDITLDTMSLGQCYALGGGKMAKDNEPIEYYPFLYWCPRAQNIGQQIIDFSGRYTFENFEMYIRYKAAERHSY